METEKGRKVIERQQKAAERRQPAGSQQQQGNEIAAEALMGLFWVISQSGYSDFGGDSGFDENRCHHSVGLAAGCFPSTISTPH
jgi:hypothetical protein